MGQKYSRLESEDSQEKKKVITKNDKSRYMILEVVLGMYDFQAGGPNEMNFKKGDIMEVVKKDSDHWWLARDSHHKHLGYIPASFVTVKPIWYHGLMSRAVSEFILLSDTNTAGAYLVRLSDHIHCHVMSVRSFSKDGSGAPYVKHYAIPQTKEGFLSLGGYRFLRLANAVHFFLNKMVKEPFVLYPCSMPRQTTAKTGLKKPCVIYGQIAPNQLNGTLLKPGLKGTNDQWKVENTESKGTKDERIVLNTGSKGTKDEWKVMRYVKKIGHTSFGKMWLGKFGGVRKY